VSKQNHGFCVAHSRHFVYHVSSYDPQAGSGPRASVDVVAAIKRHFTGNRNPIRLLYSLEPSSSYAVYTVLWESGVYVYLLGSKYSGDGHEPSVNLGVII
jgi:hypothetical protein